MEREEMVLYSVASNHAKSTKNLKLFSYLIPYLGRLSMASIFFAFYFLQKFFAKLVFFANKKQKKNQKKFSNIYNHTSSPKLQ